MQRLSEKCIAKIVSLTTPLDACRLAAVSPQWRSAADSDIVWLRFLPPNFGDILARAVQTVEYSSVKELFFRLCDSILVDDGDKRFSLKRSNGKIVIALSPMELAMVCVHWFETFWEWFPTPFLSPEVWEEMELGGDPPWAFRFGKIYLHHYSGSIRIISQIDPRMLSEKTYYAVRLVFWMTENSFGLESPLLAAVNESVKRVSFLPRISFALPLMYEDPYNTIGMADLRNDGWMEVEMGRFYCEGKYGRDSLIRLELVDQESVMKGGLILEGVDVCPLN